MDGTAFDSILILLGVAVAMLALFRLLRLPQILAYLCAGIIVGPHAAGWIADAAEVRALAEFGLVFLLFTIGLEFSLPRLIALRGMVIGLGGAQVLISTIAFAVVAWLLGVRLEGAIVIGGMLALSSTAIVMRLLTEQLEHNAHHGRSVFGVLLFQDIVVVPFLILIPALGGETPEPLWWTLGTALAKSVLVLGAILLAGRWLLRPLIQEVASARLREFFMLTVLLLTLAAAWATHAAGLSMALGAFFAGMMLGESEYRHQVESDIAPFRDILLGLFFITVGMLLDVHVLLQLWPWVLACTGGILLFKTALVMGLARLFGLNAGDALRAGLVLSQVGEFSFALLLQGSQHTLFDAGTAQIVLAAIVLSMLFAPLIVRYNGTIARQLVPGYARLREADLGSMQAELRHEKGHVIICGYGRSGQNLAAMLEREAIASIALDLDPVRVRDARDAGKAVIYGDATRGEVLEAVGVHRALALAISFNDVPAALKILEASRHLRPNMPVIVRTVDDTHLERLMAAGATEVVPESLEGSLMMGSHLLLLLDVPVSRLVRHVRDVRRDRYRLLRGFFRGEDAFEEQHAQAERLHSVALADDAFAVGKRLEELRLDNAGVAVTAVRRGGIRGPQPGPETKFRAGDVLVLYGAPEALEKAEKILLEG